MPEAFKLKWNTLNLINMSVDSIFYPVQTHSFKHKTFINFFYRSRTLSYPQFVKYVDELAKYKKLSSEEMKIKLTACGFPGYNQATQAVKVGGVDRLTDTTQYTGTHKERFDESGKGKGIAGREDVADDRGYVTGYHNADTYDETRQQQQE
ncbi:hypothetical protein ILUMI_02713 [Ignelater luminosus]|uniref:Uncharacterized protein n=1 Tax=Ignelater luminosus TaxID=2038154 RepID=A0A8K0GKL4_IGNLU|nr:hypothetical protein ILUMI_02713 [Ignelater luminosus]